LSICLLLVLAGKGLAKLEMQPVWVPAERLVNAFQKVGEPIKLSKLTGHDGEPFAPPKMAGSLKIIIAELMDRARTGQSPGGGLPDNLTPDLTLLTLAGLGKAKCVIDLGNELVWTASIELVRQFNEMATGQSTIGLRMDDDLSHMAGCWYKLSKAQFPGHHQDKDIVSLAMLQGCEIDGDAIAYKDFDGALAWKALEELLDELSEGKEGD
jgi:hypothetical protein